MFLSSFSLPLNPNDFKTWAWGLSLSLIWYESLHTLHKNDSLIFRDDFENLWLLRKLWQLVQVSLFDFLPISPLSDFLPSHFLPCFCAPAIIRRAEIWNRLATWFRKAIPAVMRHPNNILIAPYPPITTQIFPFQL